MWYRPATALEGSDIIGTMGSVPAWFEQQAMTTHALAYKPVLNSTLHAWPAWPDTVQASDTYQAWTS